MRLVRRLVKLLVLAYALYPAAMAETAHYRLQSVTTPRPSVVTEFTWSGPSTGEGQWTFLEAVKADGSRFRVWLRHGDRGHPEPYRYILQEGNARPREYRHALSGSALLPSAAPGILFPSYSDGRAHYLGHTYVRQSGNAPNPPPAPSDPVAVHLRPDLLIGPAHNTRAIDDRRRWDESDYELRRFTRDEYRELADAGVTCVHIDAEQAPWAEELGLFYWGAGAQLPFPEMLYRSQYLGPVMFLDEPAVGTRDHVIRPRLAKDTAFRAAIQPETVLEAFREHFHQSADRNSHAYMRILAGRKDVDLGDLRFTQSNLYTWETMPSTAVHQLTQDPLSPAAFVYEPAGRIGTRRTVPEMNMVYGTQLPPSDPRSLLNTIYGFLRGAARVANKEWGVSIYGAVQRNDAPFWLTYAYDLGATRFFYWDTYQLAMVPYREVLALSRHLRNHADSNPRPSLASLRRAGEVLILLPPGYDLGHVFMGKGLLWGIPELHLERLNSNGVKHRTVMSNFFQEIERCHRLEIPFDLRWDLPGLPMDGYREVVRVRADGRVEVQTGARKTLLESARRVERAGGPAPELSVRLNAAEGQPLQVTATATVASKSAELYYTTGADPNGVYHNAMVAWELYGPEAPDYRYLQPNRMRPLVTGDSRGALVEMRFAIDRPGNYRLRASTTDVVGRSTVVWTRLTISPGPSGLRLEIPR